MSCCDESVEKKGHKMEKWQNKAVALISLPQTLRAYEKDQKGMWRETKLKKGYERQYL